MQAYSHISIAIPMLAEMEALPQLLECLNNQSFRNFSVYVCVNNPEEWWDNPSTMVQCKENMEAIKILQSCKDFPITVIDKASKGKGWQGKKRGVGWARKLLFEEILQRESADELIVSLDADTEFAYNYLQSVWERMNNNPAVSALAVPYYHHLVDDESQNRALLRYEIYMRYYMLQMLAIGNPYAFTALGSAMVFSSKAYVRAGGITPLQGGEDFYLMQKFVKTGKVLLYNDQEVYPSGRKSKRVPFGTGPAVSKELQEQEASYPFFPMDAYKNVEQTFETFPRLYTDEQLTPMTCFLQNQLKTDDLWSALRRNYKKKDLFVKACEERVDGLRILQYLKQEYEKRNPQKYSSEGYLLEYCHKEGMDIGDDFSFMLSDISVLNDLRNRLYDKEMLQRKQRDIQNNVF